MKAARWLYMRCGTVRRSGKEKVDETRIKRRKFPGFANACESKILQVDGK